MPISPREPDVPTCRFCRMPVYAKSFPIVPNEHPWCASYVSFTTASDCFRCHRPSTKGDAKFVVVRNGAMEALCLLCTKETVIFDEEPTPKTRKTS